MPVAVQELSVLHEEGRLVAGSFEGPSGCYTEGWSSEIVEEGAIPSDSHYRCSRPEACLVVQQGLRYRKFSEGLS